MGGSGIIYGFQLPLGVRDTLHFLFNGDVGISYVVNANHAGIPFFGHHPKVSRNGGLPQPYLTTWHLRMLPNDLVGALKEMQ
jgi:hypothetical protein